MVQKKKLRFLTVLAALLFVICALSACGGEEEPDHVHTLVHVAAQEALCEREGNIEYWYCEECSKYFSDAEGVTEIGLEDTVLPYRHKLEYVEAKAAEDMFSCDAIAHYECSVCGKLFADEAGQQPMEEDDVYSLKSFTLTEATVAAENSTARIYASVDEENYDLAVTESTYVLRVFVGWSGDVQSVVENSNSDVFRLNINIDTQANIEAGKWGSFRVGYDKLGLYAHFSDSTHLIYMSSVTGGEKITQAFEKNNGVYVVLVRNGRWMTAYMEDEAGTLYQISLTTFFTNSVMVKATLGVNSGYYVTEDCAAVARNGKLVIGTTDPAVARAA